MQRECFLEDRIERDGGDGRRRLSHRALPELIDDGETGFLVPYLDLPAVLDRLRFFVEHPAKSQSLERPRGNGASSTFPATFSRSGSTRFMSD